MVTAEELNLITLHHKARALALWEFSQVKETDAFLEFPIGYIEKYLGNDGLNVTQGEVEVFEAGHCWLQDKPEERKGCVLRILDCIRFADIPLLDIKTMLLYPVIAENAEYVQIVQCIIYIKGGKNPEEIFCIAESDVRTLNSRDSLEIDEELLFDEQINSASEQKKAKQCSCASKKDGVQVYIERVKVLNSCCCCCTNVEETTLPVKDGEVVVETSHPTDCEIHEEDHVQFTAATITVARKFLSKPSRTLPRLPCVVGHIRDKRDFQQRDSDDDDNEDEKITAGDGKPYIIYYQEGKTQHPVPFLHLSKANEGPIEPTGYKVICKGMCVCMKTAIKWGLGKGSILHGQILCPSCI
jgi:hypothetical protein